MEAIPSHRACAHCRSQKVRCLPDEKNPDACQRCARSGRPCVFTPLRKRKQRKRTDTRVAELEREMQTMRAMLKEKDAASRSESPGRQGAGVDGQRDRMQPEGLWDNGVEEDAELGAYIGPGNVPTASDVSTAQTQVEGRPQQTGSSAWNARFKDVRPERRPDVVERGLLSMAMARALVEHYKISLYPHHQMVYIPSSCTADQLREEKPALFLAILAAAASSNHPDLSLTLDKEVIQEYANRSVVKSEKSVELVQALLVSAVWYHPPNRFGDLKYYEYIHMAATMALDLGIGTRPSKERRPRYAATRVDRGTFMHPSEILGNPDLSMSRREQGDPDDLASLECRRTFLACYGICTGVSLSLRRPAMMRVTSYTRECLDYLEQSPDAAPGDPTFVAWIRLIVIAEDISNSLSYDDPCGMASILDRTTQLLVQAFDKRLMEWLRNVSEPDFTPSLKIMFYTIKLFLHELALHVDHSPEDFKAPYQMGFIHPSENIDMPIKPLVESVAELISNSHALLDAFLSTDIRMVRGLPVFLYVRVSFAAFILSKLCLSASSHDSRLFQIIDKSSLKAQPCLDKTILFVRNIIGTNGCCVPAIFLALLFKLRQWCTHPELIAESEVEGVDIWPEGVAKAREQMAIEGPSITEQLSNSGTSPNTGSGSASTPADLGAEFGIQQKSPRSSGAAINIPNLPQLADALDTSNAEFQQMIPPNRDIGVFAPQDTTHGPTSEVLQAVWSQMDLDSNTFSLWGDVNLWPYDGMNGLDDWSAFAGDMSQMGWQSNGSGHGAPPVP